MRTFQHLLDYVDEFFLEREIFQSCRENQNTHLKIRRVFFSPKSCLVRDNVEKCCKTRQAIDENAI